MVEPEPAPGSEPAEGPYRQPYPVATAPESLLLSAGLIPGEAIVWIAHKDNIQRPLAGEERRFQPGDRQPTAPPGAEAESADEATES